MKNLEDKSKMITKLINEFRLSINEREFPQIELYRYLSKKLGRGLSSYSYHIVKYLRDNKAIIELGRIKGNRNIYVKFINDKPINYRVIELFFEQINKPIESQVSETKFKKVTIDLDKYERTKNSVLSMMYLLLDIQYMQRHNIDLALSADYIGSYNLEISMRSEDTPNLINDIIDFDFAIRFCEIIAKKEISFYERYLSYLKSIRNI